MVEVTLPASAGGRQPVHIFVGEIGTFSEQRSELNEACFLQFAAPEITSCTQHRSPGDLIKLYGYNFGCNKSCTVRFGDQLLPASVSVFHHEITCAVPETLEDRRGVQRRELQVCVSEQWSTKGVVFEYKGRLVRRQVAR